LNRSGATINGPESVPEVAGAMMEHFSIGAYRHLVEFSTEHVLKAGYDIG